MSRKSRYKLSLATLLAVFALLTTGTFIVGNTVSRFENATENLVNGFPGPPGERVIMEDWKPVEQLEGVSFKADEITVTRSTPGLSWAEIRYPLPAVKKDRPTTLLARGAMSSLGVVVGEKDWHQALFGVFFYDAAGERINRAGVTVQALAGDALELTYERDMYVPSQATHFGVLLRLFNTSGSATLKVPEAVLVRPWAGYRLLLVGLAVVWALFSLAVLYALAERRCLLAALVPLAVIATILIGVSLPGQHLRSVLLPIYKAIEAAMPIAMPFGVTNVAKIGHALGFAALAFLALAMRRKLGATLLGIVLFLIVLAVATESGQLYLTGRSGRLKDIWIDLGGAALGAMAFAVLALITLPFRRGRRR